MVWASSEASRTCYTCSGQVLHEDKSLDCLVCAPVTVKQVSITTTADCQTDQFSAGLAPWRCHVAHRTGRRICLTWRGFVVAGSRPPLMPLLPDASAPLLPSCCFRAGGLVECVFRRRVFDLPLISIPSSCFSGCATCQTSGLAFVDNAKQTRLLSLYSVLTSLVYGVLGRYLTASVCEWGPASQYPDSADQS